MLLLLSFSLLSLCFLRIIIVKNCKIIFKNPKVFQKNADIKIVSQIYRPHGNDLGKDLGHMRIENEMLSRFNTQSKSENMDMTLSQELDFFFDNVMDTVVDYFKEEVAV